MPGFIQSHCKFKYFGISSSFFTNKDSNKIEVIRMARSIKNFK